MGQQPRSKASRMSENCQPMASCTKDSLRDGSLDLFFFFCLFSEHTHTHTYTQLSVLAGSQQKGATGIVLLSDVESLRLP